jgi:hypothetical protein
MRHTHRLTVLFVVTSLIMSCASGSQTDSTRPRTSRNVISQEDLAELPPGATAMDAVRRLRSTWLRTRGMSGTGIASTQTVRVYIDTVHAGGLDLLEGRSLDGIVEIRYHSGRDATTKWGTGVGGGVIELITSRR